MKSNYLLLFAFLLVPVANAQNAPTEAFKQWATQHVHAIASVNKDTPDNADLRRCVTLSAMRTFSRSASHFTEDTSRWRCEIA
jgi:hypothetical protein